MVLAVKSAVLPSCCISELQYLRVLQYEDDGDIKISR